MSPFSHPKNSTCTRVYTVIEDIHVLALLAPSPWQRFSISAGSTNITNDPRVLVTSVTDEFGDTLMKSFMLNLLDPTFTVANAHHCASSTGWSPSYPLENSG